MSTVITPVVIVGAGPTGLATAYVLGRLGVRSIVCDQYDGVNPHPRAHVVNTRSMELLRNWGIYDEIIADAIDFNRGINVLWKHTVAGEEFGRLDLADVPEAHLARRLNASPVTIGSCAQDRVQGRLLEAVRSSGMTEVRYRTKVSAVGAHEDHVDVYLEKDGHAETLRAEYVVDAEGAGRAAAPEYRYRRGGYSRIRASDQYVFPRRSVRMDRPGV